MEELSKQTIVIFILSLFPRVMKLGRGSITIPLASHTHVFACSDIYICRMDHALGCTTQGMFLLFHGPNVVSFTFS